MRNNRDGAVVYMKSRNRHISFILRIYAGLVMRVIMSATDAGAPHGRKKSVNADFAHLIALALDVDAGGGIDYANALEVVIFNRGIFGRCLNRAYT